MSDARYQIEITPEVEAQADEDPQLAEALAKGIEIMRKAGEAVDRGEYATIDEALKAIGGDEVEFRRIGPDEAS